MVAEINKSAGGRTNPLINRNFATLWTGQAVSAIGDLVFDTTLLLWIATRVGAGQSWAAAAVSGLLLCVFIPDVVIGPFAGVFVDRWDKRHTMLVMDGLRVGLILLLLPATGLVSLPGGVSFHPQVGVELALIYGVVALTTSCQQFFGSSRIALIGDIVTVNEQANASGLISITSALAGILGPPLAAPLLFGVGVQWALALNAFSFLFSFIAISLMRAPESARSVAPGEQANAWREFRQGLGFYFSNRTLVTLMISTVIIMLGAGALSSLDIFFVTNNLHTAPSLYGWIAASFSVGAIAGGLLAGTVSARVGPVRMLWGGMLAAGIAMLVYSRLSSFLPALIVFGIAGVPVSGVNVAITPLMLQSTPRDMIGRISSVLQPAVSVASIASITIAGLLVSTVLHGFHARLAGLVFGPVDTVFTTAGIMTLAGGVYALVRLELQKPVDVSAEEVSAVEESRAAHQRREAETAS